MKYEALEMEIVRFDATDIITDSTPDEGDWI